jgi:hypothetical protein
MSKESAQLVKTRLDDIWETVNIVLDNNSVSEKDKLTIKVLVQTGYIIACAYGWKEGAENEKVKVKVFTK